MHHCFHVVPFSEPQSFAEVRKNHLLGSHFYKYLLPEYAGKKLLLLESLSAYKQLETERNVLKQQLCKYILSSCEEHFVKGIPHEFIDKLSKETIEQNELQIIEILLEKDLTEHYFQRWITEIAWTGKVRKSQEQEQEQEQGNENEKIKDNSEYQFPSLSQIFGVPLLKELFDKYVIKKNQKTLTGLYQLWNEIEKMHRYYMENEKKKLRRKGSDIIKQCFTDEIVNDLVDVKSEDTQLLLDAIAKESSKEIISRFVLIQDKSFSVIQKNEYKEFTASLFGESATTVSFKEEQEEEINGCPVYSTNEEVYRDYAQAKIKTTLFEKFMASFKTFDIQNQEQAHGINNLKMSFDTFLSQPFIILLLLKQGCLNKLLLEKELTLLQTSKEDLVKRLLWKKFLFSKYFKFDHSDYFIVLPERYKRKVDASFDTETVEEDFIEDLKKKIFFLFIFPELRNSYDSKENWTALIDNQEAFEADVKKPYLKLTALSTFPQTEGDLYDYVKTLAMEQKSGLESLDTKSEEDNAKGDRPKSPKSVKGKFNALFGRFWPLNTHKKERRECTISTPVDIQRNKLGINHKTGLIEISRNSAENNPDFVEFESNLLITSDIANAKREANGDWSDGQPSSYRSEGLSLLDREEEIKTKTERSQTFSESTPAKIKEDDNHNKDESGSVTETKEERASASAEGTPFLLKEKEQNDDEKEKESEQLDPKPEELEKITFPTRVLLLPLKPTELSLMLTKKKEQKTAKPRLTSSDSLTSLSSLLQSNKNDQESTSSKGIAKEETSICDIKRNHKELFDSFVASLNAENKDTLDVFFDIVKILNEGLNLWKQSLKLQAEHSTNLLIATLQIPEEEQNVTDEQLSQKNKESADALLALKRALEEKMLRRFNLFRESKEVVRA